MPGTTSSSTYRRASGAGERRQTRGSRSPTSTAPSSPTSTGARRVATSCRAAPSPPTCSTCTCGQGFDARRAGRAADDAGASPMVPVPLLPEHGGWKAAVPPGSRGMTGTERSGVGSLRRIAAPRPRRAADRRAMRVLRGRHRRAPRAHRRHRRPPAAVRVPPLLPALRAAGAGGGRYRGVGEEVRRVDGPAARRRQLGLAARPGRPRLLLPPDGRRNDLLAFYPGPGWRHRVRARPRLRGTTSARPTRCSTTSRRTWRPCCSAATTTATPATSCRSTSATSWSASCAARWTGLGGGPEVWREIDAFFDGLDDRAALVRRDRRTGAER